MLLNNIIGGVNRAVQRAKYRKHPFSVKSSAINSVENGNELSEKFFIFIDESNVNLFVRRARGISRRLKRAFSKLALTTGPNLHMIGLISAIGILNFKKKRKSYNADTCNPWVH
ncbi:hypothetical protein AYI68_g236 [Smittium mucronatum]|uniref:Uncharacterized protein n=1 Tax=Smittium mucronatum TaxID=133383 RepID=A0A1R0H8Q9_9FUNG|nr:hypothetical protein AYI68_g236 [Smittium mucronatum]